MNTPLIAMGTAGVLLASSRLLAGSPEAPSPPRLMHWCGQHCTTLIWSNGRYINEEHPNPEQSGGTAISVESFSAESVVMHRIDYGRYPGKAELRGKIDADGNRIVNGSVTWTFHPCCGGISRGTFNAAWGTDLAMLPGAGSPPRPLWAANATVAPAHPAVAARTGNDSSDAAPNEAVSAQAALSGVPDLKLRPGCWDVRTRITQEGLTHVPTLEEAKQNILAPLTATQRAAITPEQLEQGAKAVVDSQKLLEQVGNKGGGGRALFCSSFPFANVALELAKAPEPPLECSRSTDPPGAQQHFQLRCAMPPGAQIKNDQLHRLEDDYVRLGAESFKGVQVKTTRTDALRPNHAVTTAIEAKWTGELAAHPVHSPAITDIDGIRAIGVKAVTYLDPFRVVAVLGQENYTAARASILLHFIPESTARQYGPRLQDVLQKIYMGAVIMHEAGALHLAEQKPWADKLQNAGCPSQGLGTSYSTLNLPTTPAQASDDPKHRFMDANSFFTPVTMIEHNQAVAEINKVTYQCIVDILSAAYFGLAMGEAEKKRLLENVQAQSKITVLDPDFFATPPSTKPAQ